MSSSLGVHVTRGQQTLAKLMCTWWRDRALNLAFLWTRRSMLGKSPILALSGSQIKENGLHWALYPVLTVPSQGKVNREKFPEKEKRNLFRAPWERMQLEFMHIYKHSTCVNHIQLLWMTLSLCHYDCDDHTVIMQGLRLQIKAGASSSSGPVKLREQINSMRISLADQ